MQPARVVEGNQIIYRHERKLREVTIWAVIVGPGILVGVMWGDVGAMIAALALSAALVSYIPLRVIRGYASFDLTARRIEVRRSFRRLQLEFSDVEYVEVATTASTYLRLDPANLPLEPDRYQYSRRFNRGDGVFLKLPVTGCFFAYEIAGILDVRIESPDNIDVAALSSLAEPT